MFAELTEELRPFNASLVAVSKKRSIPEILAFYDQGQRDFGENKVQDLLERRAQLPADIRWHLIGHLQSNKVKQIAPFIHLIHSVDSLDLLEEIHKRALANGRIIDCLLQFKIAKEQSKYGLNGIQAASALLEDPLFSRLAHARICGVMGMATFTDDEKQIRQEFRNLAGIFRSLKDRFFKDKSHFKEISMGMSADYRIALEEGSTMVRIGTLLFEAADR